MENSYTQHRNLNLGRTFKGNTAAAEMQCYWKSLNHGPDDEWASAAKCCSKDSCNWSGQVRSSKLLGLVTYHDWKKTNCRTDAGKEQMSVMIMAGWPNGIDRAHAVLSPIVHQICRQSQSMCSWRREWQNDKTEDTAAINKRVAFFVSFHLQGTSQTTNTREISDNSVILLHNEQINYIFQLVSKMTYYVSSGTLNPTHTPSTVLGQADISQNIYYILFTLICPMFAIHDVSWHIIIISQTTLSTQSLHW